MEHPDPVPRIPKFVQEQNLLIDLVEILKAVRKRWVKDEASKKGIKFRQVSGGITNHLYSVWHESNPDDAVVVRLFGNNTETLIDREAELEIVLLLNKHQVGPKLYLTFENGMCLEFLKGVILTVESVRSTYVFPLIAKELARMHKTVDAPSRYGDKTFMWKKMQQFLVILEDIFEEDPRLKNRLSKEFGFTLNKAHLNVEEMEGILKKQKMPIGFCHNDLLLGNALYNELENKVTLIDFEYSFPNYLPFDVANHFNEYAGLEEPDFSKVPNLEFRRMWIEVYLEALKPELNFNLEDFERWVYLCIPCSHLFWALWAPCQAHLSQIDFDYVSYCGMRYAEYEKAMAVLHAKKILTAMLK